jgi:antitoxin CcdA
MRMDIAHARCAMNRSTALKKPTNVSINSELLADAREFGLNLSAELEERLTETVRKRRAEQWMRDNREAIQAYNKFVEENGIWSDEFRTW